MLLHKSLATFATSFGNVANGSRLARRLDKAFISHSNFKVIHNADNLLLFVTKLVVAAIGLCMLHIDAAAF